MVTKVYIELEQVFFPGEMVIAHVNNAQIYVAIREVSKFGTLALTTGEVYPPFCQCVIETMDRAQRFTINSSCLRRDPRTYSRLYLRVFIVHCLNSIKSFDAPNSSREHGEEFPKNPGEYNSDNGGPNKPLPIHTQDTPLLAAKEIKQHEKSPTPSSSEPQNSQPKKVKVDAKKRLTNLSKLPKAPKLGSLLHPESHDNRVYKKNANKDAGFHQTKSTKKPNIKLHYRDPVFEKKRKIIWFLKTLQKEDLVQALTYFNRSSRRGVKISGLKDSQISAARLEKDMNWLSTISRDSVIRDDLMLPCSHSISRSKPLLKKHSDFVIHRATGHLLETWVFLNQYSEPLILDRFTFDDFVDALSFKEADIECNLLNEIHCAILSTFVGTKESGLLIQLPISLQSSCYYGDDRQGSSATDDNGNSKGEQQTNRSAAYVILEDIHWIERLRRRMFKDGGWEQIMIGLLHSLVHVPELEVSLTNILNVLAPLNKPVTLQTAHETYMESLSFAQRVEIVRILCDFIHSADFIREYMDKCLNKSNIISKKQMGTTRKSQVLSGNVKRLVKRINAHSKKINQSEHTHPNGAQKVIVTNIPSLSSQSEDSYLEDKEGCPVAVEAKEVVSEGGKDDMLAEMLQELNNAQALVEEVEEEKRKDEQDRATLDCQRAIILGMDRYYNKYWWFEGNGMKISNAREPSNAANNEDLSSEDEADGDEDLGYLMGRIWVQGPGDEEARLNFKLCPDSELPITSTDEEDQIIIAGSPTLRDKRILVDGLGLFLSNLTYMERKFLDEGDNLLATSDDWGCYDRPEEIEALLNWLQPFGKRELNLAKNLIAMKTQICACMVARAKDLGKEFEVQQTELESLRQGNPATLKLRKSLAKSHKQIMELKLRQKELEMNTKQDMTEANTCMTDMDGEKAAGPTAKEITIPLAGLDKVIRRSPRKRARSCDEDSPENNKPLVTFSKIPNQTESEVTAAICKVQQQICEQTKECYTIQIDMERRITASRMLAWYNQVAIDKLGHPLYYKSVAQWKSPSGKRPRSNK